MAVVLSFRRDDKTPVIYSPRYTPDFAALGQSHPSEVRAPTRIFAAFCECLRAGGVEIRDGDFFEPAALSDDEILLVHPHELLTALQSVETIAQILSIPGLRRNTIEELHQHIVSAQRSCAGGTRLGVQLALQRGWAVNLKGGLHHAKRDRGEGFCFFSDIAIALARHRESERIEDVLIVDLDAHQGNGTAWILGDDPRVRIVDVFNRDIYPRDAVAVARVTYAYSLASGTGDAEYLEAVRDGLSRAFAERVPDLIIYIAGSDIVAGDPLGKLAVSVKGALRRDRLVWTAATQNHVPILMCMAGGYAPIAGEIAGRSAAECVLQFTDAADVTRSSATS